MAAKQTNADKKWLADLGHRMATWVVKRTWDSIHMGSSTMPGLTIDPISPNCYTFRVRFPEGYPFAGVSISYRPYEGRHETLLFGANDKLIYIQELDYEDHKVFKTAYDISMELKQLYNTASNPK